MHNLVIAAQIFIALSVAFVWIVRLPNIEAESREYRLPDTLRSTVGAAKICLATLLITGVWYPHLVPISALMMAILMLCAQVAHFKAKHAWQKYLPSLGLLLLSLFVFAAYSGKLPYCFSPCSLSASPASPSWSMESYASHRPRWSVTFSDLVWNE